MPRIEPAGDAQSCVHEDLGCCRSEVGDTKKPTASEGGGLTRTRTVVIGSAAGTSPPSGDNTDSCETATSCGFHDGTSWSPCQAGDLFAGNTVSHSQSLRRRMTRSHRRQRRVSRSDETSVGARSLSCGASAVVSLIRSAAKRTTHRSPSNPAERWFLSTRSRSGGCSSSPRITRASLGTCAIAYLSALAR